MDTLDPDKDSFKPPPVPMLVQCIHCGQEYESYLIEWRVSDSPEGPHGFWCCPIEGCGGAGFGFDIFPVDPEQAAELGMHMVGDDEAEEEGEWDPDAENEEDWDEEDSAGPDPGSSEPPRDEDIPF